MKIECHIPEWANCMAMDANGEWYVYANEPEVIDRYIWNSKGARTDHVATGVCDENWRDTLYRIEWE